MSLSLLNIVLYAGLVGVLIALFVATAQNKWQPRVFALLALRLLALVLDDPAQEHVDEGLVLREQQVDVHGAELAASRGP